MTWIDELEAKRKAMTHGEWEYTDGDILCIGRLVADFVPNSSNAAGIVALVNAADRLMRIARAADTLVKAAMALNVGYNGMLGPELRRLVEALEGGPRNDRARSEREADTV